MSSSRSTVQSSGQYLGSVVFHFKLHNICIKLSESISEYDLGLVWEDKRHFVGGVDL